MPFGTRLICGFGMMNVKVRKLSVVKDDRGWLTEVFNGTPTRNMHLVCIRPGSARGGHYHKNRTEWAYTIFGSATVVFRNLVTHEDKRLDTNSDSPLLIEIPAFIHHTFLNTTNKDVIVMIGSDMIYRPDEPDTYKV